MQYLIRFNSLYFILFVSFFIIEILIALYVRDAFIRPYLGDTFVVILIYCFIRIFLNTRVYSTVIAVLLFSYSVEIMQYYHLVDLLGLANYTLARIVIGTSFAWTDMVAYTAGAVIIGAVEYYWHSGTTKRDCEILRN
ncbi:MAG: DUF2809 domain-containing protein [Candidatus Thiodiazotropha sp.]|jgi:hypothetical protein